MLGGASKEGPEGLARWSFGGSVARGEGVSALWRGPPDGLDVDVIVHSAGGGALDQEVVDPDADLFASPSHAGPGHRRTMHDCLQCASPISVVAPLTARCQMYFGADRHTFALLPFLAAALVDVNRLPRSYTTLERKR